MLTNLRDKFLSVFDSIKGVGVVREEQLNKVLDSIKDILIDADVALPVVQSFMTRVKVKSLGRQVSASIRPDELILHIIHEELVETMGGKQFEKSTVLTLNKNPSVILMVGLQGSGKTTSSVKLAQFLHKELNKKVLLVSLDNRRPAAQEQLAILAEQANILSLPIVKEHSVTQIIDRVKPFLQIHQVDVVIYDTAGRTTVDSELMQELSHVEQRLQPNETLLTLDSLMGQDSAKTATAFNTSVKVTGAILTRMDSDSRGGVALSAQYITQKPVKFIGVGEKIADFQLFNPEQLANRILDQGDILSIVEAVKNTLTQEEAKKVEQRLMQGKFDLNDFLDQLHNMRKMGGISSILKNLPNMGSLPSNVQLPDDKTFDHQIALIQSMTHEERKNPDLLNARRKIRIAKGSGLEVSDLNKMLKMHRQMADMTKELARKGQSGMMNKLQGMMGMMNRPFR